MQLLHYLCPAGGIYFGEGGRRGEGGGRSSTHVSGVLTIISLSLSDDDDGHSPPPPPLPNQDSSGRRRRRRSNCNRARSTGRTVEKRRRRRRREGERLSRRRFQRMDGQGRTEWGGERREES